MDKTKLQWHPAFSAALRITLQDEMKYLEMHEEYLLGAADGSPFDQKDKKYFDTKIGRTDI